MYLYLTATSPSIRTILASNPNFPQLLTSLDKLRGEAREEALQRALGVSSSSTSSFALPSAISQPPHPNTRGTFNLTGVSEEDTQALRRLAEAVEAAVRGDKGDVLGLDWDSLDQA